jgi:hypothetical protein
MHGQIEFWASRVWFPTSHKWQCVLPCAGYCLNYRNSRTASKITMWSSIIRAWKPKTKVALHTHRRNENIHR